MKQVTIFETYIKDFKKKFLKEDNTYLLYNNTFIYHTISIT